MKIYVNIIILPLILYIRSTKAEATPNIQYQLKVTTPAYTYETSILNKSVITSRKNAFSITVLSDITVLRPGMLEITPDTYYFWMDYHNLHEIVPGTFDDANITEEIRLEGNNLTLLKSGTFRHLKIRSLDLAYNKIRHIEENAFEDLPNLKNVHLSRNQIAKFQSNSFRDTPALISFDIVYNNLSELSEMNFDFMNKSVEVIIAAGYNEIEKIDPKAFDGIDVWNLDLSHNKLKSIPKEVFTKNNLTYLVLNDNKLESLPDEFFQQQLFDLNIKNNSLKCDVQQKLKQFHASRLFYDNNNC